MLLLRHQETVPDSAKGAVITLGNFDGFHKGHQMVLKRAAEIADELSAPLAVLTTEPHPRTFFAPDARPFRLMSLRTKAHALEGYGVDALFALAFNAEMAAMLAQDFVTDILLNDMEGRHLVAGYDYRFGKDRGGSPDMLQQMGSAEDVGVTIIEPIAEDGDIYSSTLIRQHLREGRTVEAADLMGHWWTVEGQVEEGDRRGRTIGFPTANLVLSDYLQPAFGVYAVRGVIEDGPHKGKFKGVANLGRRPTFGDNDVNFEIHLFEFDADIYGEHLRVDLIDFIRPEQKFDGLDALKIQIFKDAEAARAKLADPTRAPDRYPPVSR